MSGGPGRTFEYLDPDVLLRSPEFAVVERFLRATGRTQIGWHYITDLTWIYRRAREWPAGGRVLDAGGGGGPAQFLLAELGFHVTNVDLFLPEPPPEWRKRYALEHETLPSYRPTDYVQHLRAVAGPLPQPSPRRAGPLRRARVWLRRAGWGGERPPLLPGAAAVGTLRWVTGNLAAMPELADGSFDAVVSLSALEHVPQADLDAALAEIARVSRPDAAWAITTSGTERAGSWFHAPSRGWCFSEADLARRFGARPAPGSDPARVLQNYRRCDYLRRHLADFYRASGDNGMPWGRWNPEYIPVGIH